MSSVRKRSLIWKYFDINSENNKFAVCLLCRLQISRGGEGKKAGTSAMTNHLKSKHPEEFQLLNKGKDKDTPTRFVESAAPSTNSSSTSTGLHLTSADTFERKLYWNVNDAKTKKYHYLIGEMIALDNEPLSIVERIGFTRLLQQALPRYELPSCTYITQNVIPDIYNRIFEKIKTCISNAVAVSVTSDVCTCLDNNTSFLSFTAHWLSSEFRVQRGVLAFKPFSEAYTGEIIANELSAIATRWNIKSSKIHVVMHDSDTNMVKGVGVAEYDFAKCFIHSLQKVVTESLIVQSEVIDMITKARRIVTHFIYSGSAQEELLKIQKELHLPERQLVQDISTRWNSTFYMTERLLEQKRAIFLYVADHDTLPNLATHEWSLMEQCVKLLKPFEEITKNTSSGISCISEVIPHVAELKKYLDKDETARQTADLPHMRASLKAKLESRFSSLSKDPNYLIATFLDPRFKTSYLGLLETETVRQNILLEYIKMTCDETSTVCGTSTSSSTPAKRNRRNETSLNATLESENTLRNCFKKVANKNKSQYCDQVNNNPIAIEIDHYLKIVQSDRSHDPYNWWSINSTRYPNLTKFAKVYLSAPCSSVFSERLFSEAGLVYENKRNRLLPVNAENLVFIHRNLSLVNFEY